MDILTKLDELLTKDQTLRAFERPPRHSYLHVFDWFFGTKALDIGHYDFVNHPDDMVYSSNVARNVDGFDQYVEKYCSRWPSSPLWVLQSPPSHLSPRPFHTRT